MSRIEQALRQRAKGARRGFIPFVTAGDPDIATSERIVLELAEAGADVIELGVPFSDPMADGPTIQASSQRAIEAGTTVSRVLELVDRLRRSIDTPIVVFTYLNPVFRFGFAEFAAAARTAGVDGVLVTDAVDREAAELRSLLDLHEIDLISLIAPTTSDERLEKICGSGRGFIYAVSRTGVTGATSSTSSAAEELVARARKFTDLPIAVGFGISTPRQIEDVWRYSDAAVVGSALVAEIERSIGRSDPAASVRGFLRDLLPQVAKEVHEI